MLDRIKRATNLNNEIINIYPYGSRVYGTHNIINEYYGYEKTKSDYDFIVVADCAHTGQQYDAGDLTVHLYNHDHWGRMLQEHRIFAIECFSLPDELKLMERKRFSFKLDHTALRKEISTVSSNSWVKAKKKIEVEEDYYTGLKSLFHSLRIPMFGKQIAIDGQINDFSIANHFWIPIYNNLFFLKESQTTEWNDIKEVYQPIRNEIMTEFRKYAEKAT